MAPLGTSDKTEIVGRYALHGKIASGGMAVVHFGKLLGPVGFSRPVAIKRLHPQLARRPDVRAMFIDEARLTSRIRHPNVVSTLDVVTDGGDLLIVMEYVHGEALQSLLRALRKRGERASPRIALAVMTAVLHGLHAAHEATTETGEPLDLVHRDVSPQNVMVGVDGVARVLDFGIARAGVRIGTTRQGTLKGKLAYMAPEQLGDAAVDRRADVYSAAVVLWEIVAGRRLFVREDGGSVMLDKLLRGAIEPPSAHAPETPRLLDAIVLHGLARNPDQRFATAREMALALERLGDVALPSEVGAWVERLAAPSLDERSARLKQLEMTCPTHRAEPRPPVSDRALPVLFDEDEDDDRAGDDAFPIEEGEPEPPTLVVRRAPASATSAALIAPALPPLATPPAMALPLVPAVARRRAPRALVVFAAYALLAGAFVVLAAVLRFARAERAGAAGVVSACPAGMARVPGDASRSVAPFCVDVTAARSAVDCKALGKRTPTRAEREAAARIEPTYGMGARCATSL
jgi:serine/threonine-protein kinase